jgi:hypothetical protein
MQARQDLLLSILPRLVAVVRRIAQDNGVVAGQPQLQGEGAAS